MVLSKIRLLCSDISHMPLHFTFRDSGVTQKHGFELEVDIAEVKQGDRPVRKMRERASCLLAGDYEFLSGLHHETYVYRAKGDKRFVYLAQTQDHWDDRLIARSEIKEPKQLEGKKIFTLQVPCVSGNLDYALRQIGVDTSKVEFISSRSVVRDYSQAVQMVARGELDAANVDIPFDLQAQKRGLRVIPLPAVPVIHNTTICASTELVRQDEETVLAFLRALIETIHFFKTEKQKVCDILSRELAPLIHLQGDDEVEYLHLEWSRLLSAKPYPHPLAIWNVYNLEVAQDPKVNFIGPLETWDTHYLRMIDDSGFIDRLYENSSAKAAGR